MSTGVQTENLYTVEISPTPLEDSGSPDPSIKWLMVTAFERLVGMTDQLPNDRLPNQAGVVRLIADNKRGEKMASFTDSFSVCEYCFFGSTCAVDANNVSLGVCDCAEGFMHDVVFFHDPTCSMPSNTILIWFILYNVLIPILLYVLLWSQTSAGQRCQDWCSGILLNSKSSNSGSSSPQPVGRRPWRMSASSEERRNIDKKRLRLFSVLVLTTVYLSVLALFVDGRAGRFANIMLCLVFLSIIGFAYYAVKYIVNPLFRIMGRSRFDQMMRVNKVLAVFFSIMLIVVTGIWVSRNFPGDTTDPERTVDRVRYNRVGSFVVIWVILLGVSIGGVLSFNTSRLITKLRSTSSFRDGDTMMVANYNRLIRVRRYTWFLASCLFTALPWAIVQWVLGVAPFFWVFLVVSNYAGPVALTLFHYTLTKSSSATDNNDNNRGGGQQQQQQQPPRAHEDLLTMSRQSEYGNNNNHHAEVNGNSSFLVDAEQDLDKAEATNGNDGNHEIADPNSIITNSMPDTTRNTTVQTSSLGSTLAFSSDTLATLKSEQLLSERNRPVGDAAIINNKQELQLT